MRWRSIRAVLAGVLVGIVVTTAIDIALHLARVYPPINQPIDDALALLASSYRLVIGIACAWLTARLAPRDPMKHAIILGAVGMAAALAGVVATWNLALGPRWYPVSLVILAIPQSWAGGRLFELRSGSQAPRA
jgi:MFS family permease